MACSQDLDLIVGLRFLSEQGLEAQSCVRTLWWPLMSLQVMYCLRPATETEY